MPKTLSTDERARLARFERLASRSKQLELSIIVQRTVCDDDQADGDDILKKLSGMYDPHRSAAAYIEESDS